MYNRRSFLAVLAASAGVPLRSQQKQQQQRKPDIEIRRIQSVRQGGTLAYDGELWVSGDRTISGLRLNFEYFESRGVLLNVHRIQIQKETLQPGDEKTFQVEARDVPRAVSFRLSATDSAGRDLSVTGNGPFPLD